VFRLLTLVSGTWRGSITPIETLGLDRVGANRAFLTPHKACVQSVDLLNLVHASITGIWFGERSELYRPGMSWVH
jgi:hypothetical protein